ncbi:MAG TPA: tRNA uridine-5-carboxymethylaminomethyl(34) synthesis GTPase MnmE [Cellvibrionaceae bacterium]|nr:tRNA uridine-5-carboxymethylaminomethyl(34) synthesis GTPase MnmE [Cellvibrionaceae bacterium]
MATTIAAVATAPGRGGVGVVRVSGPLCGSIALNLLAFAPKNRFAHFCPFLDAAGRAIDEGIALFFKGPHSFTGEDVLELQAHGGPVVLDMLLERVVELGARLAKPGEFSERAFLNDKMDLTQAEAISDLIAASSRQAAQQAVNSLQGAFSKEVHQLVEALIALRIYVEAAIDFPEEEVDFLSDGKIAADLVALLNQLQQLLHKTKQGSLVREGMKIVLAGKPNAGKSSLLNALTERDSAIVTPIAGTTRDPLREHIHIDGMPLHLVDTAGIRVSDDLVEQMGIDKAWQEIRSADRILLLLDASEDQSFLLQEWPELFGTLDLRDKLTLILNKIDLVATPAVDYAVPSLAVSAKHNLGIDALKTHLKQIMGFEGVTEGSFSARRRHIEALEQARGYLAAGQQQLQVYRAGELLAEDLRQAQEALNEITGAFSSDDLLGRIFGSFCIGK